MPIYVRLWHGWQPFLFTSYRNRNSIVCNSLGLQAMKLYKSRFCCFLVWVLIWSIGKKTIDLYFQHKYRPWKQGFRCLLVVRKRWQKNFYRDVTWFPIWHGSKISLIFLSQNILNCIIIQIPGVLTEQVPYSNPHGMAWEMWVTHLTSYGERVGQKKKKLWALMQFQQMLSPRPLPSGLKLRLTLITASPTCPETWII